MDKDQVIKELNAINRKLASDLDQSRIQSSIIDDLKKTCIRDIIPLKSQAEASASSIEGAKLTLSKSLGNPNPIEKNEEHEFARKHTLIHLKSNSICTWIPKNSCSSLRYSMAVANGAISGIGDIEWIHKNNYSFNASNKELLTANYTFVILRNPFKRLLSFFSDKLCNTGSNTNDKSYEKAKLAMGTDAKTSFAEFIEILWQNPGLKKANEHLQDQCDFLVYKNYHDYLPLEQYNDTATTIQKKTGVTLEDVRPFNSIHTSYGCTDSIELDYNTPSELIGLAMAESKKPNARKMYSSDLIRKVGSLYLGDILLYLKTIDNSEEEMRPWLKFIY